MLIDPPRSLYLVLIVATIIAAAVCASLQTRRTALIFLGVGSLLLGLFLIDTFIESPREEASRRVQLMAFAATESNPRAFISHISDSFNVKGRTKADIEGATAWSMIRQFKVNVKVWGFSRADSRTISENEIEIGFTVKGEAESGAFEMRYVKSTFVKEGEAWRMKTIVFYNALNPEALKPELIPGFP